MAAINSVLPGAKYNENFIWEVGIFPNTMEQDAQWAYPLSELFFQLYHPIPEDKTDPDSEPGLQKGILGSLGSMRISTPPNSYAAKGLIQDHQPIAKAAPWQSKALSGLTAVVSKETRNDIRGLEDEAMTKKAGTRSNQGPK